MWYCSSFPYRSFFVGTSSLEELLGIGQCCTFRGSLSKLDVLSGTILWQTFTLPDNQNKLGGYAGAAIWGSSPSIDIKRNHVYIATGNLYSVPLNISQCQAKETHPDECVEPDNQWRLQELCPGCSYSTLKKFRVISIYFGCFGKYRPKFKIWP